jgi:hypothetical protein
VLRRGWSRAAAPLIALLMTGFALSVATPAQAGGPAGEQISAMKPVTVQKASTAQIKSMAANGSGVLMTLPGSSNGVNAGAGIQDITCYLAVGTPYGGGAPDADVLVDGLVFCDGWVHLATLEVQLYYSNNLVASDQATFPYTYGVFGTVGVPNCTAGTYFGAVFAVLARYDHYPPVIGATKRSPDQEIGCGTPGGPGIPTPPNCQIDPRLCARHAPALPVRRRRAQDPAAPEDDIE